MIRRIIAVLCCVVLSACTYESDLDEPPVDLGNFRLGHNVVVAPLAATSSAISREATEEELTTALRDAIAARFDRYDGSKRYHLGVSVEGYVLARAGVPVVAAPKSAMIIRVTVWDDAQAKKLNVPPEQMTILENIDGESLIGTGWTQSADKQLEGLARNAAKAIETFLLAQNAEQGWFMDDAAVGEEVAQTADDTLLRELQSDTVETP
ncbi:hypothetical protein [Roseobacter weihaiensis]|uniref:hypothetical protein n=1 Tax=Roseobacter weihaiensis TaxID=2763262 RepID=UPI001D0B05C5|nr:hypothetical protein [Roseobacter sp. H9]